VCGGDELGMAEQGSPRSADGAEPAERLGDLSRLVVVDAIRKRTLVSYKLACLLLFFGVSHIGGSLYAR
jgi:hypothetical protein